MQARTPAGSRPLQRLSLAALARTTISPVISPLPTAVALLGSALRGGDRAGMTGELRRAVLARLRKRDVAALLPLRTGERGDGSGGRPNEIVPVLPGAGIDAQLDAVRGVDPDRLAGGIEAATQAGHPTGAWRAAVVRDPARWLRDYAGALQRAWPAIEPVWSRSAELLDRDVERISVASARGAGGVLIAQLLPHAALAGEDLVLPSHSDRSGRLHVRDTLVVLPLVAPAASCGWTDDYGERCLSVRYTLPAAWRLLDGSSPPVASLAALLGPQRATILRWLDRPATAGGVAELLHGAPSMATHHLRALEASGLVTRTRDGRTVRVHRTARGSALVGLYEDG